MQAFRIRMVRWAFFAMLLAALVAPRAGFAEDTIAMATPARGASAIDKGQRVFICGHSFHVFVEQPLARLAEEAGKKEHKDMGCSFIGGSYPMQHWKLPDEKNLTKKALGTGNVDVLTIALNRDAPDEGVELFSNLAFNKNPDTRVMLQISWLPWDGFKNDFKREDHDRATPEFLKMLERTGEEYVRRVRAQATAIEKKRGKDFIFVVPVGPALLTARNKVIAGQLPGVEKQSDLFIDGMGHPSTPLKNLATFCWFAAIYRQSPVGLTALDTPNDDKSKRMNRVLQKIAWEAVTSEPQSGVTVEKPRAELAPAGPASEDVAAK